jgi:hypothetical protein
MNKLKAWRVIALVASLVLAMGLVGGASASTVVHRVSAGTPDFCSALGGKPGCDANWSLVALQMADGSVTGEWQDQFSKGIGFHIAVNCLNVIGNQAYISGVVTQSQDPSLVGEGVVTKVVDNGRSANDPPDEIGFSIIGTSLNCNTAPGTSVDINVLPVPQGQVVVR